MATATQDRPQTQPVQQTPYVPRTIKIRLNPEDAAYGVNTKAKREAAGADFTAESLENWKRACENTAKSILRSLPKKMQDDIKAIRPKLPRMRPYDSPNTSCCNRCQGKGYRPDFANWIVVEGQNVQGKRCFKCAGSGIEPSMEPIFFRRRTIDILRKSSTQARIQWANKVLDADEIDTPYLCVLEDIAEFILQNKDFTRLPH